jgi:hypothetical protein
LWQAVEAKQKFISQIMSSKSPVRSCEDVDETALSYAEIKALCAGNPLIAEKMNLDIEVAKLRMLKAEHQSQKYRLEDDLLKNYPKQVTAVKERIAGIEKDMALYSEHYEKTADMQQSVTGESTSVSSTFAGMTINDVEYKEKEPAGKALLEACKGVTDKRDKTIGEYMGFTMSLHFDSFSKLFQIKIRGNMTYETDLGTDTFGNITRINNILNDLPKKLDGAKAQLETLLSQQEAAKEEVLKPFTLVDELAEKEARLALLDAELNIDGNGGLDVLNDTDNRSENENENESDYYDDGYDDENEQEQEIAKTKPPLLDTIQAYNEEKKPPIPGKKPSAYNR